MMGYCDLMSLPIHTGVVSSGWLDLLRLGCKKLHMLWMTDIQIFYLKTHITLQAQVLFHNSESTEALSSKCSVLKYKLKLLQDNWSLSNISCKW